MIVLVFPTDEAQRIVEGVQTVATYPGDDDLGGGYDHHFLLALVGQTVAVARLPEDCLAKQWTGGRPVYEGTHGPHDFTCDAWDGVYHGSCVGRSEGAIVGSVIVAACVPIVAHAHHPETDEIVSGSHYLARVRPKHGYVALDDQLPFADFSPGRWALIFTDPAPCEQRCPVCDPAHIDCTCAPIPYTIDGPIGEWTP